MVKKDNLLDKAVSTLVIDKETTQESVAEKKPKKRDISNVPDLCMTCNNARNCMYRLNKPDPVVECEEFDGYALPPSAVVTAEPELKIVPDTRFKGLCVNCNKRETCTFPKPEAGVWHCEDYE